MIMWGVYWTDCILRGSQPHCLYCGQLVWLCACLGCLWNSAENTRSQLLPTVTSTVHFPLTFRRLSLHVSNFTHPPITERETFESPKTQFQIHWLPLFQFQCSNCLEFAACHLAESPRPLWLQSPVQNFPFSTGISTDVGGSWCVCVCVYVCVCVCYVCVCIFAWIVCVCALSFLDRNICAIQEPSIIIIVIIIIIIYYCSLLDL